MIQKLWLDDERVPPDDTWFWAKTFQEAIKTLAENDVEVVSLDHDLGDRTYTGYDVLSYIERRVRFGKFWDLTILVHSMNPVGRQRMLQAIDAIERHVSACRHK